ncbi:hypothetical protein [Alicyclobacillus dauci]|uniref:Uncharacterized protein n=1 Tax=Alicyclobacillus dauci TaxID=1475485 RepID=A0ABY6Z190_9BACL|nr:hypothetical protein [Alicyclobacillus dauci]WAH36505.1 hypothetical protein NZD86_20215 [Alicyclobacillus dauci]
MDNVVFTGKNVGADMTQGLLSVMPCPDMKTALAHDSWTVGHMAPGHLFQLISPIGFYENK